MSCPFLKYLKSLDASWAGVIWHAWPQAQYRWIWIPIGPGFYLCKSSIDPTTSSVPSKPVFFLRSRLRASAVCFFAFLGAEARCTMLLAIDSNLFSFADDSVSGA